ncbi:MAG TPA: DUF5985 family protein [Magnetospirillaceae bacterium]|jgi:hypothetical protein
MSGPPLFGTIVYLLCFITSTMVMLLLRRSYARTGSRLVLWSTLAFVAFALNNLFLFLDLVVFPTSIDLRPVRDAFALIGLSLLLYGFVGKGS